MTTSGNQDPKRTVRATRRRPSGPNDSGQRERATAPTRDRPPSGGSPPSGGGGSVGGGGSSGGWRPSSAGGGRPAGPVQMIGLVAIALIALCFWIFSLFNGGDDVTPVAEAPSQIEATARPRPTRTPRPVVSGNSASSGAASSGSSAASDQSWTILLYQDADDKILEKDIYIDLNEAERIGSTDKVQIVAQVDRFRGGFDGDGNWTSTKRFLVEYDEALGQVRSQEIADVGEANMAAGATLVDFVTWAIDAYPADKYVLILSDHGMGWPGGWSDPAPGGRGDPAIPLSTVLGDQLYLNELDDALQEIRDRTGLEKFELIGMDACLMSHLEVYAALAPHARYAVASQETEPALGWAYTGFLKLLTDNSGMGGDDLARAIVETYIGEDQRIVDDAARAELVGRGYGFGDLLGAIAGPSAGQVARQMEANITLAAVDLTQLPVLMDAVNQFAYALQRVDQRRVAEGRAYAQSFTSVFGREVPPSYLDLGSLVEVVNQVTNDADLVRASNQVLAGLDATVIAERHGAQKPGATGISIYFPNSQLYRSPLAGDASYSVTAARFAEASLWDDFLAFHYTGDTFEPQPVTAATRAVGDVRAPGAGAFTLSPVTRSSPIAAPGEPVLLSTDVSGDNVGYAYLFAGYYDAAGRSLYIADTDYLQSGADRVANGVYYPDWGEGDFTLEFEWEPLMFAIDDGRTSVQTLLRPGSYGASAEDAVYTVDGIYTYTDGVERAARLYFSDGVMRQVFGFTGDGFTGAPREILPQPGDTFTVLEQWIDLDENGGFTTTATEPGGVLTFGAAPFTWRTLDAAVGRYVVGFIVEDLDGNSQATYTTITVQ